MYRNHSILLAIALFFAPAIGMAPAQANSEPTLNGTLTIYHPTMTETMTGQFLQLNSSTHGSTGGGLEFWADTWGQTGVPVTVRSKTPRVSSPGIWNVSLELPVQGYVYWQGTCESYFSLFNASLELWCTT